MALRSVRTQLTIWNTTILALILLGCGAALRYRMAHDLVATVDRQLADAVRPFVVRRPPFGPDGFGGRFWQQRFGRISPGQSGNGGPFGGSPQGPRIGFGGPGAGFDGSPDGPNGPGPGGFGGRPRPRGPQGQAQDDTGGAGAPDLNPGQGGGGPGSRVGGPPVQPQGFGGRPTPPLPVRPERLGEPGLVVLNRDGNGVGPSRRGPYNSEAFQASLTGKTSLFTATSPGGRERIYSVPQRDQSGNIVGGVQSEESLAAVDGEVDDVSRTLLALLPVGLLAAGLGGALLTSWALRPVHRIAGAIDRIQAEDLSRRLPEQGRDEFARLSATLNAMLSRLQHAFDEQRRFTMDASHELKTPLAAIKAKTSVALHRPREAEAYRAALETIDRSADRMAETVQDLLLLAQADAGQLGAGRQVADARELATAALDSLAELEHAPIHLDLPAGLRVRVNAGEITRLLRNLLENAVRHTPASGAVHVRGQAAGRNVEIEVADSGEGIAPEHLPHVMERFYRVDSARSRDKGGTGLGLAICKGIVDAHGGQMTVESTLGQGTTVRLILPS